MDGLKITSKKLHVVNFYSIVFIHLCCFPVKSFIELGPKLLRLPGVHYLLSEVFSQDPLERYFSRQRHRGGSNENPSAFQVPYNAATLVQQQSIYRDLKSMNVEAEQPFEECSVLQPLHKRRRTL